jgi:Sec-independent protein translocase protein TatA
MISLKQILVVLFVALLIFGDLRKLSKMIVVAFVNLKTFFQKTKKV